MKNPVATPLFIETVAKDFDQSGDDHDFVEPLLIQIGFNKTGTTFLSSQVYPRLGEFVVIDGAKYAAFDYFCDYVVFAHEAEFEVAVARQLFAAAVRSTPRKKCHIYTHEAFTFRYYNYFCQRVVIERLATVFESAKFALGTRDQRNWLVSHWGQYVRGGGLLNLGEFADLLIQRQNSDLYMAHFGYLARQMEACFGTRRMFVYDTESLRDLDRFLSRIAAFIGVPKPDRFHIVPENEAPSASEAVLLRLSNHLVKFDCGAHPYSWDEGERPHRPGSRLMQKVRYRYKYARVRLIPRLSSLPLARQRLTDEQSAMIQYAFAPSNAILSDYIASVS